MTTIKSKIRNNLFGVIWYTLMLAAIISLVMVATSCTTDNEDFFNGGPVIIKAGQTITIAHSDNKNYWIRYSGLNEKGWAKMRWPGQDEFINAASWDPGVIHEHYLLFYGSTQFKISILDATKNELIIQRIERMN